MTKAQTLLSTLAAVADAPGAESPDIPSIVINGEARAAHGQEWFETVDPSTESVLARVARGGSEDVDHAARAARGALDGPWGRTTPQRRGELLLVLAGVLEGNADLLARLESYFDVD